MKKILYYLFITSPLLSTAQFEPKAGQIGSTAIYKDSSAFKIWAKSCKLNRGYMNIANPSAGYATVGDENSPLGKAGTTGVASLGDGGSAILTFDQSITNGNGFDFAIFENGFAEAGGTFDFLEYGFVEVSSDGNRFVRFPSQYSGQDTTQVGSFAATDTRLYHNLAGKYVANYGTPFDLEELKDSAGLDVNNITHVKIVDVVGSINPDYATHDSKGNIINDTWPTAFASSGFDLDAVGAINVANPTGLQSNVLPFGTQIFPNPAKDFIQITTSAESLSLDIMDISGQIVQNYSNAENRILDISSLKSGFYTLNVSANNTKFSQKLIIK